MPKQNSIYEITQMMSNQKNIKEDFSEASRLIFELFKKKYIDGLTSEITKHKNNVTKNPTKEINLMNALKPFFGKDAHTQIDNFINALINYNTMLNIQKELSSKNILKENSSKISAASVSQETTASKTDSCIQKDGIYEIDQSCLENLKSLSTKNKGQNSLCFILLFIGLLLIKQ